MSVRLAQPRNVGEGSLQTVMETDPSARSPPAGLVLRTRWRVEVGRVAWRKDASFVSSQQNDLCGHCGIAQMSPQTKGSSWLNYPKHVSLGAFVSRAAVPRNNSTIQIVERC